MDTTIDAKHEAAVYSSYRRSLRSLSSGGNRNSRAGARKQRARGLTSERYKLPISTVKAIVQRHELDHGITHAPTANLIERRRIEALYELALAQALESNPERSCESCGGSPDDELELPNGATKLRGPSKLRFDSASYRPQGNPRFLDVCLPCWLGELDRSLNSHTIIWSPQTV